MSWCLVAVRSLFLIAILEDQGRVVRGRGQCGVGSGGKFEVPATYNLDTVGDVQVWKMSVGLS